MSNNISDKLHRSGGPPTKSPIGTGENRNNDDGSNSVSRNLQSIAQQESKNNKELNLLRQISNWTGLLVTIPTGIVAGVTGIGSFLQANTSFKGFEQMENFANYSTRLAYAGYGVGGLLTNIDTKNIFGTLGYGFCTFVQPFVSQEIVYPLSAFSSGLDSLPLAVELLGKKNNPDKSHVLDDLRMKIQEKYNPTNDLKYELTDYISWTDSLEKGFTTLLMSLKDAKSKFDFAKPIKSIIETLKRPDFNLITSTCGYLASFGIFCFTPFKFAGEILRDLFGFESDIGVWQGGLNGTIDKPKEGMEFNKAGNWRRAGDIGYATSGPPYTLGSLIDIVYRFTKVENLHLTALGLDRMGAACMAAGNIFHDAGKKEASKYNHNYYTAA